MTRPDSAAGRMTSLAYPRLSILLRITVVLSLALSLPGCFFTRLTEVKQQFCDFDANFSVQRGRTLDFLIHQPVFLDSDVLLVTRSTPTNSEQTDQLKTLTFEIDKIQSGIPVNQDMALRLDFDRIEDDFKLKRVQFDENLTTAVGQNLLSDEMFEQAAHHFCTAGLSLSSRKLERDITDSELAMLPSIPEMLDQFGPPSEVIQPNRVFAYEYQVRTNDGHRAQGRSDIARVVVWFDENGNAPLRMETRYSRFHARADFQTRKIRFEVSI